MRVFKLLPEEPEVFSGIFGVPQEFRKRSLKRKLIVAGKLARNEVFPIKLIWKLFCCFPEANNKVILCPYLCP